MNFIIHLCKVLNYAEMNFIIHLCKVLNYAGGLNWFVL